MSFKKGGTNLGRKFSLEWRTNISKALKGKKLSPSHCLAIGRAHKGIKQSPDWVAKRMASRAGYKHSKETIEKIRAARIGKGLSQKLTYSGVHQWLVDRFGKANHCEFCLRDSSRYEYALIKGKEHGRKRENYMQLCLGCHKRYDMKDDFRQKMSTVNKLNWIKRKHARS